MKTKEGFMLRNVAGKDIVVAVGAASMDFNGLISLNETGAFIWKLLEKGADYDTLLKAMLEEYDIDEQTAKEGIDKFLESVRKADLIEE
ncbi:MAG: PqqD family protein [Clostridia bacterium]|nr:PqqD family protein [Clostridia bacterium]